MQIESKTDQTHARDHEFGLLRLAKAEDSTTPTVRSDGVEMAFEVESETLWTSEAREKSFDCAAWRNAIDRIEARRGRSRHIKMIVETKCQVICGNARLERRVNENLFARADLE